MNKTDLIGEWLEYAQTDLRAAHHMFDNMHPKPVEIICYHCQQTVEKAMKSYLISHDVEPPYIHDLDKLRLMCMDFSNSFEVLEESCRKLTGYTTAGRYPSHMEINEADAKYALSEAASIYKFCTELITRQQQEQENDSLHDNDGSAQ